MEELKIRGYVTPEDFTGSDLDKLQKAVDTAEKEDICKVIIEKEYEIEAPVRVPGQMHIVFGEGAKIKAKDLIFVTANTGDQKRASWSFENQRIYIQGAKDAVLEGNLSFFHAGYIVLEDLYIKGSVTFEFCREIRMERNIIVSENDFAVSLMRGCNNFIVQYNNFKAKEKAFEIDVAKENGPYVMGKDTDIHELIVRENIMDAKAAVTMRALDSTGIFNVQIDHTQCTGTGIVIGRIGDILPPERFFNITATAFVGAKCEREMYCDTKHCLFGE